MNETIMWLVIFAIILCFGSLILLFTDLAVVRKTDKKLEKFDTYGWDRPSDRLPESYDTKELCDLMMEEGYPVLRCENGLQLHSESKYMARRMWKREYEAIISLAKYVQENNIDMPIDTMMFLVTACGAYATPGVLDVSVSQYKEFVLPILEKHGYTVGDELFEGIDPNAQGMKMISHFPNPDFGGLNFPRLTVPEWENELRRRVVDVIMADKKGKSDGNEAKGNGKK